MALALLKRIENATTQPLEVKTEVDEQPILTAYTALASLEKKQINVANVATLNIEKSLFVDEPTPVFKQTVLMVRYNGKPQTCIHCGYWEKQKECPWWTGACAITGEGKTNKSQCDVPSYEEVLQ